MSTQPSFTQDDFFALCNRLAEYPAAENEAMLAHFFQAALPVLHAGNAFWTLLVRLGTGPVADEDLCHGWRTRDILVANPSPTQLAQVRRFLDGTDKQNPVHLGQTTINVTRASGRFRVERLRGGLVDWETFRHSDHHRLYYEAGGITDRLWAVFPVSAAVESCFCFDRVGQPEEPFFSVRETELAATILGGLGWFHRRLVASRHVGAGHSPPTPTEARILRGLLTGQSEKMIADALGQSVHTTHDHVGAIFKKFGVQSRVELMALWL